MERPLYLPPPERFAAGDQAAVRAIVAKYGRTSTAQTYLLGLQSIARMDDAPPAGIVRALYGDEARWRQAGSDANPYLVGCALTQTGRAHPMGSDQKPYLVCPLLRRLVRKSQTSRGRCEKALLKLLDSINAIFIAGAAVPGGAATARFWKLVTETARRDDKKAREHNYKTPGELATAFSLGDLAAALDRAGWRPGDQRWLYAAMLRYMPAKRQDYWATHVLAQAEPALRENQVIVPPDGPVELHLWIFKTAKFNKSLPYKEKFGPELSRAVRESLAAKPRRFLFTKSNGQPYDRTQFTTWSNGALSAILGKRTTLNAARRAWKESMDPKTHVWPV